MTLITNKNSSLIISMDRFMLFRTAFIIFTVISTIDRQVSATITLMRHDVKNVTALVIVDVQNCFTSNGTLAVEHGDDVIPVINNIRRLYVKEFDVIVLTQDWHCRDHISFASQHRPLKVYSTVNLTYSSEGDLCEMSRTADCQQNTTTIEQRLWPDHCVINTTDANIHGDLIRKPKDILVQKGFRCRIDSYSAFYDNGRLNSTSLDKELKSRNVTQVFVVGLATDVCVYFTAKDSKNLGYKTWVILDATRGINKNSTDAAVTDMETLGIQVITSAYLADFFSQLPNYSCRLGLQHMWYTLGLSAALTLLLLGKEL